MSSYEMTNPLGINHELDMQAMNKDREEVIKAIRGVTTQTKQGIDNHSKAQDKREAAVMVKLFAVLGLPKPSEEEIKRCYPW